MSTLYVAALCGFALLMLLLLVDAVVFMPRVADWGSKRLTLEPVEITDRHPAGMSLAGFERRLAGALEPHEAVHNAVHKQAHEEVGKQARAEAAGAAA